MGILRIWIVLVLAAIALPAAACERMPAGADRVVPTGKVDLGLLDAAFRAETNRARCSHGLKPLKAARPLTPIAATHSRWMAGAHKLSHDSSVRGQRGLADRLRASGLRFRSGTENIGMVPRFRLDGGQFRIEDASACRFSRNGQALPPHSYASLARHTVSLWMNSPSHRRNILDRKVSAVANAAAFDPAAPHCGRFWMTQTFLG
jgi:uncharacterized protein YkwD